MENERAIEILDPEHREAYESLEPVNEACRMGVEALRRRVPESPYEGMPWILSLLSRDRPCTSLETHGDQEINSPQQKRRSQRWAESM